MTTSPLLAARTCGQSIWLDNLSRGLCRNGTLQQWITAGLAGVTSNPAIFQKAIAHDALYQADLARLAHAPLSAEERYERLAIPDVQAACDAFSALYAHSLVNDGYVSLEVSPGLAHDCPGTVAAANRLWQAVNRPNLMIKIPATPAGVAALPALLAQGINVNVTLIFSRRQLRPVLQSYAIGLQQAQVAGQPVQRLRSVASVFLSRLDGVVDPLLAQHAEPAAQTLAGSAAISMAKLAYREWQEWHARPECQALWAAGAAPQRLLWASTSTKNPAYSDLLYVEPLIGPHTVNTLPDATLAAFQDHGQVAATLEHNTDLATQRIAQLASWGIDLDDLGDTLQHDGLRQFESAFAQLLTQVGNAQPGLR